MSRSMSHGMNNVVSNQVHHTVNNLFSATGPTNVVIITNGKREPTAMQIFLGCEAPQFNAMQQIIGILTCATGGSGLMCGACCGCYGFERAGCLNVCLAGWFMEMTCYLGYGWLVACLVGMKMMSGTA
ncbi:Transmembrane_domain-containing protein [Hexamita inflata]|uniref:Transmembrane domain-containing protein n=1 Tax=Hexamita inflata TaxID=28002 RepID=A0AA86TDX4_9EUKA|nr:Transmembrane domain-containing protein [Hexamita inflata]